MSTFREESNGAMPPAGRTQIVNGWSRAVSALRRSRRARLALNGASVALATVVTLGVARHFRTNAFPLAHADPVLLAGACALFLLGYAFKAYGWSRLFAPSKRPRPFALAAASGAACLTGVALPGRLDDAVRVAVVRRQPGCPACLKTLALSLFTLGLIDTIALTPLASVAAVFSGSAGVAAALGVVAAAGVGAAGLLLGLPRFGASERLLRFRVVRMLTAHWPSGRDAAHAIGLVFASWLVRGAGLCLLLGALGIGLSLPLALVFLCAGAASGALPVAPAGAATQAGAGAAILIASGVPASHALSFAIGAQVVVLLVGATVVLAALAWHGVQRLVPRVRFA
jgi:uncharacterized membrane protein YbhN (UPF0104 family)